MLTPKQQRFVDEYLIDLNATAAAKRAGYSERTAEQQGYQLLQKTSVAEAIAARQAKVAEKLEITREWIVAEMHKLASANMHDYMRAGPDGDPYLDFSKITRDQAAALAEVTVEDFKDGRGKDARDVRRVKFKLTDKRASLMDLAKLCGFVTEKHEHSGPNGGPILVTDLTDADLADIARRGRDGAADAPSGA